MKLILNALFFLLFFCSTHAQEVTNYGTDFWAGYGHNQFFETNNSQILRFYVSTKEQPANVTVSIDSSGAGVGADWARTYNIPANSVVAVEDIPKGVNYDARLYSPVYPAGTSSSGLFRKKGIHIVSDVPVAVYSHVFGNASSGASMLLPSNAWGYSYRCISNKQQYAGNCAAWAFIVAKADSTLVEIIPSAKTRVQNITGLQPGIGKTIVLMRGQIYQIMGAVSNADANGNGTGSSIGVELTGTIIKSLSAGKPIAVFCGSSRTNAPYSCGSGGGDSESVQIIPGQAWGKQYLTAPLSVSNNPTAVQTNIYKVLVKDTTTVVKRNGIALTGLINGAYYLFESNTADIIEADQPVLVAMFMSGGATCLGFGIGDPEMIYLAPVQAGYKKTTAFRTGWDLISSNLLTLIVPTPALVSLKIDNAAAFDTAYVHPQDSSFTVVVKKWTAFPKTGPQSLLITCDAAFTAISYGLGSVESYAAITGLLINAYTSFVNTWLGKVSEDWNNPGNWSAGSVPDFDDEVTILAGTTYSPTITVTTNAVCKKLIVATGVHINVQGTLVVAN